MITIRTANIHKEPLHGTSVTQFTDHDQPRSIKWKLTKVSDTVWIAEHGGHKLTLSDVIEAWEQPQPEKKK